MLNLHQPHGSRGIADLMLNLHQPASRPTTDDVGLLLSQKVQRLKSPLEGFSPGVHLRGRCHGDRIGGRPARSVLSGAVSTANR